MQSEDAGGFDMQIAMERHSGRNRPLSESQEWLAEPLRTTFQHLVNRVDFGRDRTRSAHLHDDNVSIATRDFVILSWSDGGTVDTDEVRDPNAAYWEPFISSVFMKMIDNAAEQHHIWFDSTNATLGLGTFGELQSSYALADRPGIVAFLAKHDYLYSLLFEAPKVIRQYFDSETQLSLKLSREPDAVDDQRLFLLIHTTQPISKAMDLLDNLDDAWWLDRVSEARGKMSLDISPL